MKVTITEDIHWYSARDLQGDLHIEEDVTMTIHCRTSMPKDSKIVIAPGATLYVVGGKLHNACGDQWLGIETQSLGSKKGRIVIANGVSTEDTQGQIQTTRLD